MPFSTPQCNGAQTLCPDLDPSLPFCLPWPPGPYDLTLIARTQFFGLWKKEGHQMSEQPTSLDVLFLLEPTCSECLHICMSSKNIMVSKKVNSLAKSSVNIWFLKPDCLRADQRFSRVMNAENLSICWEFVSLLTNIASSKRCPANPTVCHHSLGDSQ